MLESILFWAAGIGLVALGVQFVLTALTFAWEVDQTIKSSEPGSTGGLVTMAAAGTGLGAVLGLVILGVLWGATPLARALTATTGPAWGTVWAILGGLTLLALIIGGATALRFSQHSR